MLPTLPVSVKSPALSPPLSVTLVKGFTAGQVNLVSAESLRKTKKKNKKTHTQKKKTEETRIKPLEGITCINT